MDVKHLKWGRLAHASLYPEDHGYILSILANIHARASLLSKTHGLIYHSVYGSSYGSGGGTAMCRLWEALQVDLQYVAEELQRQGWCPRSFVY